ncbi:MAG: cellulose binding domain-containing protein, partial [Oscillospiraceae bacterium]|nr:cellulose binding domain-containing protein [Oscillospiraceae bacterium]
GGWADNENVQVTLTNTGTEPIRNWGLQYEPHGNIVGIWNGEVVPTGGINENIVKSVMHNSDIPVGASVSFGYTLMGVTGTPDSFTLCNYRVEKEDGYTVSLTTNPDWGDGFTGLITIANTTNTPIMAWELGFSANFAITSAGDFIILDSVGTYYKITGFQHNGNIPANSSITLNFNAASAPDAAINNFSLTEIVVLATPPVPDEPETCEDCGEEPCVCLDESEICEDCGEFPCICFDFVWYSVNAEAFYDSYNAVTTISWEATDPTGTFEVFYSSDNDEYYTLTTVEDLFSYEYQTSGEDFIINYFKVNQVIDEEIAAVSNICYVIWSPAGILPSEYMREWEIEANDEVLSEINDNNPHFQLSIELEAAGVPSVQLNAAQSGYSYAMQNDMTLGIIPELIYPEDFNVGNVTLKFEIADEYLDNVLGIYSEHPELEGIKRLNVFKWFDELNMSLPIETKFDVANNVLYTEVDRLGTYAIMDMEMWFEFLESNVEYEEEYEEYEDEEEYEEDEEEDEYEGTTEVQLSIPLMGAGNSTNPDNPITYSFPQIEFVGQDVPPGSWQSVAYGNGLYVAVGLLGILTSTDGLNWNEVKFETNWRDITYANGLFVAVGGGYYDVAISADGIAWTLYRTGFGSWHGITYGDGLFVVVGFGFSSNSGESIMTSPDGINWTPRQTPGYKDGLRGVAYGNNMFVAAGHPHDNINIMISSNGIDWSPVKIKGNPANINWYGITFGNGIFVAAGHPYNISEERSFNIATSANGRDWTFINPLPNDTTYLMDIAYGDGLFVAVGYPYNAERACIMVSTNGKNWTIRRSSTRTYYNQTGYLEGVDYGNGAFIVCGVNTILKGEYEAKYKAITASGWKEINLTAPLNGHNGNHTDNDGLTDWEEIATEFAVNASEFNSSNLSGWWNFEPISINGFELSSCGYYINSLPTIQDCMNYVSQSGNLVYVEEALTRYKSETLYGFGQTVHNSRILPINSDPTEDDTDGDGLWDGNDLYPLKTYNESVYFWRTAKDATIFDVFPNMRYIDNYNIDKNHTGYIFGQSNAPISNMTFGGASVANTGCGVISIYNSIQALGKHKFLSEIIYEFDLNPHATTANFLSLSSPLGFLIGQNPWNNGFIGANPFAINDYLIYHGFKPEMTLDETEFASWAKEDRVFIILYLNDIYEITAGAHYAMIQADKNGTYTTYNLFSNHTETDARRFNRDLHSSILKNGNTQRGFICGFYIPVQGGSR